MQNNCKDDDMILLDPRRNQCTERKKLFEEMLLKEIPGTNRTNEAMHAVLSGELAESTSVEVSEGQIVRNRALLQYLASLANSNSTKDKFDFSFVESLLKNGADINSTDKSGQTVFHEVARSWNIDVAKFLIKHGANMNQQDLYGRSPLHVAAAVDYTEMLEFLLQNGADIHIKTSGEGQTAMHYAAKNDAINSLEMLLAYGANIDARDSKNRTPLQVSAEMNRSKAAKLLITEGAPAGVYDNVGNSALSLLIEKIPEVALEAMDQFHSVDTVNRKEFYFLNYLEGRKFEQKTPARTPLEIAVQNERFDIIMHPVMQRLVGVKWKMYGKWGAILDLVINLIYTILWSVLGVTLSKSGKDLYSPLSSNVWRLIIVAIIILLTLVETRKQFLNTTKTRQEHKAWKEWRASELERDVEFCHPRWPQEAQYVHAEIKAVRNLSLLSGSEVWLYFDWIALSFILATIISHITFFHYSTMLSKKIHHYIIIPLILLLWFRMFKYARPFESAGPYVVIFGSAIGDIVKWGFLNLIIYVPFACAFSITFGDNSATPAEGYKDIGQLMYNIFSMMVVDVQKFDKLEEANPFMARLLCASFIAIAAIVTLNLLIALLTNTFERLYENAIANAVMQRARTILLLEKSLWRNQEMKYYDFIKDQGSPEVISKNIGRLLSLDKEEATIERVRDDVKVIVNILDENFGRRSRKGKKSDLHFVRTDVQKMRGFQEDIIVDVRNIKLSLDEMKKMLRDIMSGKTTVNTYNQNRRNYTDDDDDDTSNDESKSDESSGSSDDDDRGDSSDKNKDTKGNNTTNREYSKIGNIRKVTSDVEEIMSRGEYKKTTLSTTMQTNVQAKSPNKTEVKLSDKKTKSPPKPSTENHQTERKLRRKKSNIDELRKKFEESTEPDVKKRNRDPGENQYASHNEEYVTAYPPWPLVGMCQQGNTTSNDTVGQKDPIGSSPMRRKLVSFDGYDRQNQGTFDKDEQSFSSTYLHFNDDSGGLSHPGKPRNRKLGGRGRRANEDRNENAPNSRRPNVTMEPPVERIYQKFPGINSEVSSSSSSSDSSQ